MDTTSSDILQSLYLGNQYSLLPLKQPMLDMRLNFAWAGQLAVLATIDSHRDRWGKAHPSLDRIATLSGVSKSTAKAAITRLVAEKWLTKSTTQKNGFKHTTYTLSYRKWDASDEDSQEFAAIPWRITRNGLWARMTPTAKLFYVALKLYSSPRQSAYIDGPQYMDELIAEDSQYHSGSFITLGSYEAFRQDISLVLNVSESAITKARKQLFDMSLIKPTDQTYEHPGWIMPSNIAHYAPIVLSRLQRQAQYSVASRTTKALLTKDRKRTPPYRIESIKSTDDCTKDTVNSTESTVSYLLSHNYKEDISPRSRFREGQ